MYRTFKRSARNFAEFANAGKIEIDTGLTISEARSACQAYNDNRTESEIDAGTKLEFEEE